MAGVFCHLGLVLDPKKCSGRSDWLKLAHMIKSLLERLDPLDLDGCQTMCQGENLTQAVKICKSVLLGQTLTVHPGVRMHNSCRIGIYTI